MYLGIFGPAESIGFVLDNYEGYSLGFWPDTDGGTYICLAWHSKWYSRDQANRRPPRLGFVTSFASPAAELVRLFTAQRSGPGNRNSAPGRDHELNLEVGMMNVDRGGDKSFGNFGDFLIGRTRRSLTLLGGSPRTWALARRRLCKCTGKGSADAEPAVLVLQPADGRAVHSAAHVWSRLDGRTACVMRRYVATGVGPRRRALKGVGNRLVNKRVRNFRKTAKEPGRDVNSARPRGSSNATRTVSQTTVFRFRSTVFTGRYSQHPSPSISPTKDPKMEAAVGHVVVGWVWQGGGTKERESAYQIRHAPLSRMPEIDCSERLTPQWRNCVQASRRVRV
ncbi:hypothetical protein C8R44DRAFT_738637 [Mycena epipterygia]|nr:hypothetical protein C8R44DRAFT_738637 [Mycena epipterygia]